MTARIANGKKAVSPHLLSSSVGIEAEFPPLNISPEALRIIRRGMREVMYGPLGTARKHQLGSDLGGMAGKTGTVQVKRITKAQREAGITQNIDRPWAERDHALLLPTHLCASHAMLSRLLLNMVAAGLPPQHRWRVISWRAQLPNWVRHEYLAHSEADSMAYFAAVRHSCSGWGAGALFSVAGLLAAMGRTPCHARGDWDGAVFGDCLC